MIRSVTCVSGIRTSAANAVGRLSRVDAEIASLRLTIRELESEYSNLDQRAIEAVYREAQCYLPKLHHDWNDLIKFIQNRVITELQSAGTINDRAST